MNSDTYAKFDLEILAYTYSISLQIFVDIDWEEHEKKMAFNVKSGIICFRVRTKISSPEVDSSTICDKNLRYHTSTEYICVCYQIMK